MVADNANIQGKKLDINSVIDKINEDGSKTIKSSKIWIDEENQSLGAKFTQVNQTLAKKVEQSDVNNAIDNVKVGAVNLIRNAKTMLFDSYKLETLQKTYLADESGIILVDELGQELYY